MDEMEQRWLYALSAPLVALSPYADYIAPTYCFDVKHVDIEGGWGITTRVQLLEMLRTADNGHATQLNEAYRLWERCLPSQWQALVETLDSRQRAFYDLASRTFGECGSGGIRAWDIGRMGFLLRCAVLHGWIDITESLWLHSRMAVRARHYYDSWTRYLNAFVVGKAFWNCLGNEDWQLAHEYDRQGDCAGNTMIINKTDRDARFLLAQLPWDMPLHPPERPDTLGAFDWS